MNPSTVKYNTLAEILQFRSVSEPNQTAYTFLVDGENTELNITYNELNSEAKKIAGYLQSHCKKGDRAVLFYPPGLDFIKAFFGCLCSGIIAVPSYPPKMNRSAERMNTIISDAKPTILLTTSDTGYEKNIKKNLSLDIPIVNTDEIAIEYFERGIYVDITPDDLAFLQYTSGSTGSPKGVMISHKNLLHNEHLMQQSFNISRQSIVVGWLPFYHDMGLIGNILQPFYSGCTCILMSPVHFLQKPLRWLHAISKYKGTVSGGPNFAYDLCCEKISDQYLKSISLHTWKVAFNGAEPIRAGTLKKFYEKFGKCRFSAKAFQPCYGMAETTLLVSANSFDKEPVTNKFFLKELQYQQNEFTERLNGDKVELVSCGSYNGFNLTLVDENGYEVEDEIVGEIWLQSESVAKGYWNNKKETDYTFKAQINGKNETYLRTGDLGIKKDGELYIAGRIKDLIILNGRNYYPQDLEFVVSQSNDCIVKESVAAFSVDVKTEEQLIIVAEIEYQTGTKIKPILQDVKRKIVDEFEITTGNIVFVRKGTLLKTTSGKVQRKACKEAYLSNSLHTIGSFLSEVNIEKSDFTSFNQKELEIYNIIKDELNNQTIEKDDDLFNIGLDSIRLTRIAYRLGEHYDKEVTAEFVIENNSISKIAKNISFLDEFKPLANRKEGDSFPASKLQEVIWFNQQRNPESTGYNIPVILEYNEDLNIDILNVSIRSLINKYAVLRTNFQLEGNTILQKIRPSAETNIKFIDLSGIESSDLEKEVLLSIKDESVKVFNLEKDPLIRAALIKKGTLNCSFLIVIHHIIVDGTSVALLLKELKETYQRLLKSENPKQALADYDFIDFTLYEETRLSDNELVNKKEFWLEELKGEIPKLDLPFDYSLIETKSREGKSYYFNIDEDLLNKLKTAVNQTKLNQFSYLLTAYTLLLHRLSGLYDLIVGTPVSMRQRKEFENIPGLLINTAMFRTKLNSEGTLKKLVNIIYEHSRKVLQHADYPFSQVLRDLKIPIGENQLAVSSVFFNYLDFKNNAEANQLFETYKANPGVDLNFDLNLYALPENDCIKFRLDYCKNQFKEKSAENFSELFIKILNEIVESPETILKELRAEITETRNSVIPKNTFEPFTESDIQKSITKKFDEISAKYPERIALKTLDETYTYTKINYLSNNIAKQIEACYMDKPSAVGLLFGHEANMIFSILGVLRSGNYYVPLDAEYPFDRLAYILNDADIHVILTNNLNLPKAKDLSEKSKNNIQLINLDEKINSTTEIIHKDTNNADSLAYILYTSGSTGTPKGVMQTHEYVMHLTYSFTNSLHISKDDCFTLIPSFNFSASVMDLFGVLLNGASLYLVDIKKEGIEGLVEGMEREGVTVYHSVPTVFREVAEGVATYKEQVTRLKKLRLIYLAGEPLLRSDVELYKKNFPDDCILANGLGCTEFNICRQFFIDKHTDVSTSIVPIGYKAIGVEVLIVDENRVETKNQESGEIAIRSKYLSIGYWNSADLTSQKFKVVNPETKERIYYTGDLGRKLADGCLMHLGRKDFQVKLRGQRIELAEIETAMLKIDGISRAVVSLKDNESSKYLCGYFIAESKRDARELKTTLKEFLPEYMIPSYFVQMELLPLTDTGKVDRRNLPAPEVQIEIGDNVELTDNEVGLSKIWSEILKIEQTRINKNNNFFEIGGNSLSAIQLIQKIHKTFDKKVELKDIFSNQTIEQQAFLVEKISFIDEFRTIEKIPEQDTYEISHSQKRLWILSQLSDASTAYHISAAVELIGVYDNDLFQKVFESLIERHESFRTAIIEIEGEPRQKIIPVEDIDFRIENIDLIHDLNVTEHLNQILNNKANIPFKLSHAPLIRVIVIRTERDKNIMLLTFHHIISDGWSMDVILKDLLVLCDSFYKGIKNPLKPLSFQYKDYTIWQNQQYNNENLKIHKDYWEKQFAGEIPILNFPTDKPRPKVQTYNGNQISFEINEFLTGKIKTLCLKEDVTLFMSLLGFVKTLLYRYTGQNDIIVGVPMAGRDHLDLEDQVGFYVNTLALRTSFEENIEFGELLKIIKKITLEAFEHQRYSFDWLIGELNVTRDLSRSPLFDIMVILQNKDINRTNLPTINNLKVKRYEVPHIVSKFDITFNFSEQGGKLRCDIEYNTDLFDIDRFVKLQIHLLNVIEKTTTESTLKINEFDFLTYEEQHEILYLCNETNLDYPKDKTIIDLFEEQVNKNSEATAIIYQRDRIDYQTLNFKANQLAMHLKAKGVQKEDVIGLMVNRSIEMMIGLFGILKSGCAYLPIDPEYPQDRIDYMLENSCSKLIITQRELGHRLVNIPIGRVDIKNEEIYLKEEIISCKNESEKLAYLIYTSGSTGRPKGIMVEHRNVVNFITGVAAKIPFETRKSLLSLTTISFDIFVLETFLALSKGLRVIIGDIEEQSDPLRMAESIQRNDVEMFQLTPSRLKTILSSEVKDKIFSQIKILMIGGEALPVDLLTELKKIYHGRIFNMYGPTETTVWSTIKELTEESEVTLGEPIANTQIYILDANNRIQPFGVAGELCIGGDGVTRGYWNLNELTKEKFIKNPFIKGDRIYKTGDLARRTINGSLEFIGRLDNQVKIRGYRIELGEIEQQLISYQKIKEAVVISNKDKNGENALYAYIVSDEEIIVSDIRNYLLGVLPEYMIPSNFIKVEDIPLTPNKKIDTKALINKGKQIETGNVYIEPKNDIEVKLTELWKTILKIEKVSVNDNFFELGGNSLKLIQLNSLLTKEFGRNIPVVALFRYSTISAFSDYFINMETDQSFQEKTIEKTEKMKIGRERLKQRLNKRVK